MQNKSGEVAWFVRVIKHCALSELAGWCIGCGNGQSIGKLVYNSQSGLSVFYSHQQLVLALIISSPCPRLVSSSATCATCHVSTVCRAGGWPACTARLTLLSPCRLSRSPDPDKLTSCIVYISGITGWTFIIESWNVSPKGLYHSIRGWIN